MVENVIHKVKPCAHLLTALNQVLASRQEGKSSENPEIYVCFDHKTKIWGVTEDKNEKQPWRVVAQAIQKYSKDYSHDECNKKQGGIGKCEMVTCEIHQLQKTFLIVEFFFSDDSKRKYAEERESKPFFGKPFPIWNHISISDEIAKLVGDKMITPRITLTEASIKEESPEQEAALERTLLRSPVWDFYR